MITFEVQKKGWLRKKYHFRIESAGNHKCLASSGKGYNLNDILDTINLIKTGAADAKIEYKNFTKPK